MAGRGRLNAFDLLPDDAADDVLWAMRELAQRKRTQDDIREEFNGRLAAKGIAGVKRTAFNAQSLRVASAQRRMRDARAIFDGMAAQQSAGEIETSTLQLGEFIKTLITELLDEAGGARSTKQAMELARAYQATVSAQKVSTEHRQKLDAEAKARVMKAAETAIGEVAGAGHAVDRAAIMRKIREDVYGLGAS